MALQHEGLLREVHHRACAQDVCSSSCEDMTINLVLSGMAASSQNLLEVPQTVHAPKRGHVWPCCLQQVLVQLSRSHIWQWCLWGSGTLCQHWIPETHTSSCCR